MGKATLLLVEDDADIRIPLLLLLECEGFEVLTAADGAQDGWLPAQDDLATLSTNSVHRTLPDASHAMLVEDEATAHESSQAILDLVQIVRGGGTEAAAPVPTDGGVPDSARRSRFLRTWLRR